MRDINWALEAAFDHHQNVLGALSNGNFRVEVLKNIHFLFYRISFNLSVNGVVVFFVGVEK